jgi:PiT family inorganic phosphate transporter
MTALILLATLFLAYSNGANDNFKSVATLFGSGTSRYGSAIVWATVTTFSGAMLGLLLSRGLVSAFSGKGLVPDSVALEPAFLLAVSLGAGLTVLLATWAGLPVSTTHALTGALIGAGFLATGGGINLPALLASFVLPLLCGPPAAMLLAAAVYPAFRWARLRLGIGSHSCLCVGTAHEPVCARPDGTLALARTGVALQMGQISECVERYQGRMLGLEAGRTLDSLHYLSGGAVGFARGLNDAPKIVALLLAAGVVAPHAGLALVAIAMAAGGLAGARRVAETMSWKITRMNQGQGFAANLVTSLLVILASRFGLPVSTTHVSVGALYGIGTVNGIASGRMMAAILLAWLTTLPLGALRSGAAYGTLRIIG